MAAVDYKNNGSDWGETCKTGKEQSPIDLKDQTYNEELKWSTTGYKDYTAADGLKVKDLGKTI